MIDLVNTANLLFMIRVAVSILFPARKAKIGDVRVLMGDAVVIGWACTVPTFSIGRTTRRRLTNVLTLEVRVLESPSFRGSPSPLSAICRVFPVSLTNSVLRHF